MILTNIIVNPFNLCKHHLRHSFCRLFSLSKSILNLNVLQIYAFLLAIVCLPLSPISLFLSNICSSVSITILVLFLFKI